MREVGVHLADRSRRRLRSRAQLQAVDVRAAEPARAGAVHHLDAAGILARRARRRLARCRPASRRRRPAGGSRRMREDAAHQHGQVVALVVGRDDDEDVSSGRIVDGAWTAAEPSAPPRGADDQRRIDHGNPESLLREKHQARRAPRTRPAARSAAGRVPGAAAAAQPGRPPNGSSSTYDTTDATRNSAASAAIRRARPAHRVERLSRQRGRATNRIGGDEAAAPRGSRAAPALPRVSPGCARAELERWRA